MHCLVFLVADLAACSCHELIARKPELYGLWHFSCIFSDPYPAYYCLTSLVHYDREMLSITLFVRYLLSFAFYRHIARVWKNPGASAADSFLRLMR